jgi:alkylhydroperoxidase family enzyme
VPAEQLEAACGRASLQTLPARERAILEWIDQVTRDARGVTDELVAATLEHVRDDQLVELTVLAGTITMLNQYCTAFGIPPPSADG